MKLKDLCKEEFYEVDIHELSEINLCLANEEKIRALINKADEIIKTLLKLKKSFKKLECNLPEDCDITLYEIYLKTGGTSLDSKIEYEISKNRKCKLYMSINLHADLYDIKKYKGKDRIKPLYKLIKYFNIEEDDCPKYKVLLEDLIYTVNRLIEFLVETKKILKRNIRILNKEVC